MTDRLDPYHAWLAIARNGGVYSAPFAALHKRPHFRNQIPP